MPGSLIAALGERYSIERELGQGRMATVYLARDLRHDRDVAVKVLRAELVESLGWERFLREIRLRSAELKDAIGPVWYRWPDIVALQAHPRYPEVLSRLWA